MRQLIFDDVFTMSRILSKLDITIELDPEPGPETDSKETEKDDVYFEKVGMQIVQKVGLQLLKKVAENAHLARNEINDFLGDLSGMTGEDFSKLQIKEAAKIIKEFKELDGIRDFFESAGLLARFK
jgi:hypothetical protein